MSERGVIFADWEVRATLDGPHNKLHLDATEIRRLHVSGKTINEIAQQFRCSNTPVRRICRELGLRRPAKRRPGVGAGATNPAWKGGRRIRPDGYVVVWTPNGERLEHQLVMEQHLGRALMRGEVVHHKDRNKQNNVIANLELTTQSAHAREHAQEMHSARYGKPCGSFKRVAP